MQSNGICKMPSGSVKCKELYTFCDEDDKLVVWCDAMVNIWVKWTVNVVRRLMRIKYDDYIVAGYTSDTQIKLPNQTFHKVVHISSR